VISASILRGGRDHGFFFTSPFADYRQTKKVSQGVIMFKELQPLLARRSLTITVAALNDSTVRVNVIPHSRPEDTQVNEQIKYSHKDEVAAIPDAAVKALTTPISLTGTAEEIDAKLSDVLLQFVECHGQLQATFDRACTEISEAVKAIDERNKNKS
jgi:PRTRC genetic system protein E